MPTTSLTADDQSLLRLAQSKLADWPARLAMVPVVKPLSAAWMPGLSPVGSSRDTGSRDTGSTDCVWWSWCPEEPLLLRDGRTGEPLPDTFPYRNHAAFRSYHHCLRDLDLLKIGQAYQLTGDRRYVRAITDLLVRYSEVYPTYPTTIEEDAPSGLFATYGPDVQGTRYTVRTGAAWGDTEDLQLWLRAYLLVRDSVDIREQEDLAICGLAREIVEFESLPNLLYINDKYHNSLTNYYEAFVLIATLWGDRFQARDTITHTMYSGGDLAQLAVNGPKGLRMFAANAFDRNGVYWELSASYTGYTFHYFARVLKLLNGYSDPARYVPGEAIKPFYQPLQQFDASVQMPELWRGVIAQTKLALNNALYVPTNDTNYLEPVNPDWLDQWAELLDSDRIARCARGVRQSRGLTTEEEGDVFPPCDPTLMPASGAATLRGSGNRFDVHLDWHRMQDYHSHKDPLNLVACVEGYLVLSDLGYHLGHPLRHIVSERTAAHNTVTVDGQDSAFHGRGRLEEFIDAGEVQMVQASVPDAYAQCELYRRTVISVGDRYLLDFFSVRGGTSHDYTLLSRADDSLGHFAVEHLGGTLADPAKSYDGPQNLDSSFATPSSPYEAMQDIRRITRHAEVPVIDWPQRDRPDLVTRVHHLTASDFELALAKVPHQDRRADMATRTDEVMIARRCGRPGLQSHFVSLVEVLSGRVAPLESVRRLNLASDDADAVAVEIVHEQGVDVVIYASAEGLHQLHGHAHFGDISFTGQFVHLRYHRDSGEGTIILGAGRLRGRFGLVEAAAPQSARVTAVDTVRGLIRLDEALRDIGQLAGAFVEILNSCTGEREHWLVSHAEDERTLQLDLDHSALIVMEGVIEKVENERTFWSGVNLCSVPAVNTPIRIGPVGDFTSRRHQLEYAQQTGLPLRVGGTTTNHEPRRYAIGLDKSAALTAEDVGKSYWVSGIEVGDCVFTRPVTRTQVTW